jgi:hypothetical protein
MCHRAARHVSRRRRAQLTVARQPVQHRHPAHPFVPKNTGRQPTYRIADLTNPNLKPAAKARMKKDNDEVLAGKIAFTARSSCQPAGVPGFDSFGGAQPYFFVQTPKEVLIIFSSDEQVRHVYLDVPHSPNLKPSWYGESIGHYEGDSWWSIPWASTTGPWSTITARRIATSSTWWSAGE